MKPQAFTLVEMLIVLTLLATFALIGIPAITGYQKEAEIKSAGEIIISTLRQAQSKSITGEGTLSWGVHFDVSVPDQHFVSLFQGSSYASGTDSEPFYFIHGARLGSLSLSGGGNDVLFNRLTGGTSQYGAGPNNLAVCVTYVTNTAACLRNITITANGKISEE